MSQKVDWAKYVAETEKNITNKVSVSKSFDRIMYKAYFYIAQHSVEISGEDQKKEKIGEVDEEAPEQFSPAEASLLAKIIRKGLVENKNSVEVQRKDPKSPCILSNHLRL
ncbi:unnamed protein product [Callosobruchus maculatus]|uniref:Uncharacterized protein n=1 Tax=Callosobruchus maculatus TaxID=64391 RepID=A0A653CIU9_CALMS|nr:unnamed protein product [Callosobruchus maculatus]